MNQPVSGGVFDKPQKPRVDMTPKTISNPERKQPSNEVAGKIDMESEFEASNRMRSEMSSKASTRVKDKMESTENAIAKANAALNGISGSSDDKKDLEEMEKISEEDQNLAEALIFNGYAEYNAKMVNLPKRVFTMCSTSADDVSLVDEMVFEFIKSKEDPKTGNVELPDSNVKALRMSYMLGLAYKGPDGRDFMDTPVYQLTTIKKAIQKCKEFELTGELDNLKALRNELKNAVKHRAARISSMPTALLDYLNQQRYEFDAKMYSLMTTKNLLPKS